MANQVKVREGHQARDAAVGIEWDGMEWDWGRERGCYFAVAGPDPRRKQPAPVRCGAVVVWT